MYCMKCLSRPTTQARITNTYVLQTVDTAPFYGRSANIQWIIDTWYITINIITLLSVIVCTIEYFSTHCFRMSGFHIQKLAHTCRR